MQSFKSHTQQENPNHQTQSSTQQSIHPTVYPHYVSSTNQPIIKKHQLNQSMWHEIVIVIIALL